MGATYTGNGAVWTHRAFSWFFPARRNGEGLRGSVILPALRVARTADMPSRASSLHDGNRCGRRLGRRALQAVSRSLSLVAHAEAFPEFGGYRHLAREKEGGPSAVVDRAGMRRQCMRRPSPGPGASEGPNLPLAAHPNALRFTLFVVVSCPVRFIFHVRIIESFRSRSTLEKMA